MSNPNDWNKSIIEEFRANNGLVGGNFAGSPLLLLHTIGAKSGEARINPVAFTMDGDQYIIIASKAGAPTHPDWYYNLVANPSVTVEVGIEKFSAQASVSVEPERTRLFDQMIALRPGFAEYAKKTTRVLPVIVLTRINPIGE